METFETELTIIFDNGNLMPWAMTPTEYDVTSDQIQHTSETPLTDDEINAGLTAYAFEAMLAPDIDEINVITKLRSTAEFVKHAMDNSAGLDITIKDEWTNDNRRGFELEICAKGDDLVALAQTLNHHIAECLDISDESADAQLNEFDDPEITDEFDDAFTEFGQLFACLIFCDTLASLDDSAWTKAYLKTNYTELLN
mgnify:FL=1